MKQTITVVLDVPADEPYEIVENHNGSPYEALRHFFEDIDFKVESVNSRLE